MHLADANESDSSALQRNGMQHTSISPTSKHGTSIQCLLVLTQHRPRSGVGPVTRCGARAGRSGGCRGGRGRH